MAALQEIVYALRNNFPDKSASIQLQEIVKFIENYTEISAQSAGGGKKGKLPPNAKITRQNASMTREEINQATLNSQQRSIERVQGGVQETSERTERLSYVNIVKKAVGKVPKNTPK